MKNYTFNVSNMTLVYISDLYIPVWDTRKFFQFLMNPAVTFWTRFNIVGDDCARSQWFEVGGGTDTKKSGE